MKSAVAKAKISMVVALSENDAIGRDDGLPWRMRSDLKHFKALSAQKVCVFSQLS